jgi:hypothetical protein
MTADLYPSQYASIHAETIVIGATDAAPAEDRRADVVEAAYQAAQAAVSLILSSLSCSLSSCSMPNPLFRCASSSPLERPTTSPTPFRRLPRSSRASPSRVSPTDARALFLAMQARCRGE